MVQAQSVQAETKATDFFIPNLISREVLTMYRTINIDISHWIDKYLTDKGGLITEINWDEFDKFVAHAHNYDLKDGGN